MFNLNTVAGLIQEQTCAKRRSTLAYTSIDNLHNDTSFGLLSISHKAWMCWLHPLQHTLQMSLPIASCA